MTKTNKRHGGHLRIGFTYNIEKTPEGDEPPDKYAEFDSDDTIDHIKQALESSGHTIIPIEANKSGANALIESKLDFIFNIAEGLQNSENRESIFPSIFEFLDIPYAGSDPLTLAITLDKPAAKKIWLAHNISTPRFQIVEKIADLDRFTLNFPVIIKPSHEGTSRGIFNESYVEDIDTLKVRVKKIIDNYKQPVIVEEFIDGREFTVTVIGNNESFEILPPVEISFEGLPPNIKPFCSYEVKTIYDDPNSTVCPANITKEQEKILQETALKAYKAVKTRDFGRVDMRLTKDNVPYIIEINPLPGMSYSPEVNHSMIKAAKAAGYEYNKYICRLLNEGLKRGGFILNEE